MRSFFTLFVAFLAIILGACSASEKHGLGTPVALEIPTNLRVEGPRFSTGPLGQPLLSWMEPGETGATLRYAILSGQSFGAPFDVVADSGMFVNWADLPSVTALSHDHWIAHWLRYSAAKAYAYDVVTSQSFDGGETWSDALLAHTDGTTTEHGFVSVSPDAEGAALLWLDGRFTPDASMTLRSAIITKEGSLLHEQEVDDSVCDCCQTDIAISSRGALAVYRDRTSDEIRDIYITRHDGQRWQKGELLHADNWEIPGCPVNGPSIFANGDFVAVAWFSAADDRPIVRVAISTDGGEHFGPPVVVAAGKVFGYVGLVQIDESNLAVSWVGKSRNGASPISIRTVDITGTLGEPLELGTTRQLRVFPQLAISDDSVIVVWTDDVEGGRTMKAVAIPWRAN
jgi:hypothetical protein